MEESSENANEPRIEPPGAASSADAGALPGVLPSTPASADGVLFARSRESSSLRLRTSTHTATDHWMSAAAHLGWVE